MILPNPPPIKPSIFQQSPRQPGSSPGVCLLSNAVRMVLWEWDCCREEFSRQAPGARFSRSLAVSYHSNIAQYRYIKIQPETINTTARLRGINPFIENWIVV